MTESESCAIKDGVYLENSKNVNQSQEAEVNTVIVNSVSPVVNNPTDEEKLEKIESTPVKQASPEIFDDLPTEKHPLEEEQESIRDIAETKEPTTTTASSQAVSAVLTRSDNNQTEPNVESKQDVVNGLGEGPRQLFCPYCKTNILTETKTSNGLLTWISAAIGCCCCLCCVPFFVDRCKDVEHICPNCRGLIGIHKRI